MYEKMKIFLGIVMIVLGLFMAICPKKAAKKEERDNPKAVAKVRVSGFIVIGCGVLAILWGCLL